MFQPDLPTPWLWTPRGDDCQRRTDALNAMNNAKIAEYYRLLYVAMTRARDRLYIYGYTSTKTPQKLHGTPNCGAFYRTLPPHQMT